MIILVGRKLIVGNISPVNTIMDGTVTECKCNTDSPVSCPDVNDADINNSAESYDSGTSSDDDDS